MTDKHPVEPSRHRVYLVDDHAMVRRGLHSLIDREPDLTVCGEAGGEADAFKGIRAQKPDVAIIDLRLEQGSGSELIRKLHDHFPNLRVLVFTMKNDRFEAERLLRSGAHGYLTKEEGPGKVIPVLRQLLRGEGYRSEPLAP